MGCRGLGVKLWVRAGRQEGLGQLSEPEPVAWNRAGALDKSVSSKLLGSLAGRSANRRS